MSIVPSPVIEKVRLEPSPVSDCRSARIGSEFDVRDVVLGRAERDDELLRRGGVEKSLARNTLLASYAYQEPAFFMTWPTAPLVTFKAIAPRSALPTPGVTVAVMTLPLVVSESVAACSAATRAARSSVVTNS